LHLFAGCGGQHRVGGLAVVRDQNIGAGMRRNVLRSGMLRRGSRDIVRCFAAAVCLSAGLTAAPGALRAHEVWIAPDAYRPATGMPFTAQLRNGEQFAGSTLMFNPSGTARLALVTPAGQEQAVSGRLGDIPAIQLAKGLTDGLNIIAYQSTPSTLTYRKWEKFIAFAAHKDFPNIAARHDARGLPRTGFVETYTRFAKALIGVGSANGADRRLGLETEIVALNNPYQLADGAPLRVQVFYQGQPRGDAQVELFAKPSKAEPGSPSRLGSAAPQLGEGGTAADGTSAGDDAGAVTPPVKVTLHRTDADGIAVLPMARGMTYLVDAVVLRTPKDAADDGASQASSGSKPVWETLWAALTFQVPRAAP